MWLRTQISSTFIFLVLGLCAQESPPIVIANDTVSVDSTKESEGTIKTLFSGRPGRAFGYSLLLPGLGQAYNKSYWKIPVVYVALGVAGYFIYDNTVEYRRFDKAYRARVDDPDFTDDEFGAVSLNALYENRQYIRKNRERSYIALGLIYLLGAVEAYVDAHLQHFEVADDLSLHIVPATPSPSGSVGLGLMLEF